MALACAGRGRRTRKLSRTWTQDKEPAAARVVAGLATVDVQPRLHQVSICPGRLGEAAVLCYGEPFVRRGAAHAMLARFWNALRREPLVHFLALAALLFVIYDLLMPSQQEPLVIDP